jgi:hypothetical protein
MQLMWNEEQSVGQSKIQMSFPLLLSTDGRSLHAETEAIIQAQFMSVKRLFNLFSFNVSQSVSQSVSN